MQKYVVFIFGLLLVACIAACGSGGSTAPTQIYDLPATPAPSLENPLGGAVQGTPLVFGTTVTITTLAGTAGSTGFSNYSSTGGTVAMFNQPTDITTDGTDFYVTDFGNNAIRQITRSGVVRTLQCTSADTGVPIGFNRPTGITTDGTFLYVVDSGSNTIRVIEKATSKVTMIVGSTTGLAGSVDSPDKTAARFNRPIGITTDGVSLYVTDYNNATVRRIVISTGAVSTLAGASGSIGSADGAKGDARFNRPARITTDGVNLYLTDFMNRTIRQIVISTGVVTTLAGSPGSPGTEDGTTAARFKQPNGITTDGTNLFVTDSYQNTIRSIVIATGYVTTMPIPDGSLHAPIGITTDGASLLVADTYILNIDNTYTYSNSILRIQ